MESQFMTFWDYFFHWHNVLEIHPSYCINREYWRGQCGEGITCDTSNNTDKIEKEKKIVSFLFYCWQGFHGTDYQTLFKHLLTERHSGCFQVGTITNYAAMNVLVLYRFLCGCKFSFLLDKCPGVKLLGHMVNMYLVFKETAKLFSRWLHHFTFSIPTSNVSIIQFLCMLINIWYHEYIGYFKSPNRWVVMSHDGLDLH